MAQIIPCSFTSDVISTQDGCADSGGLIGFYIAQGSDLDLVQMANATHYDNSPNVDKFLLPPVMLAGKKLKKLDVDEGSIHLTSKFNTNTKLWTDRIEFDSEGLSATKMANYRAFFGCCGYVIFGVMSNGLVVSIGLQPSMTSTSKITLSKKPLRTVQGDFDSGKGSDDNAKQVFNIASEGESTHGMLIFESSVTASQLEALL